MVSTISFSHSNRLTRRSAEMPSSFEIAHASTDVKTKDRARRRGQGPDASRPMPLVETSPPVLTA